MISLKRILNSEPDGGEAPEQDSDEQRRLRRGLYHFDSTESERCVRRSFQTVLVDNELNFKVKYQSCPISRGQGYIASSLVEDLVVWMSWEL